MSRVKLEFGAHVILSRIGMGFSVVNADSNSSVPHVGWSVAGTTVERTPRVSDRFVGVVLFNRRLTIVSAIDLFCPVYKKVVSQVPLARQLGLGKSG